jgi:hypothetical protein
MGQKEPDTHQKRVFNSIATIAANTTKAPVVLVFGRIGNVPLLLGAHGLYLESIDDSWAMCKLVRDGNHITYTKGINRNKTFQTHPLFAAVPYTTSIAFIPVGSLQDPVRGAIIIPNPELKWPFSAGVSDSLSNLAIVARETLFSVSL